MILLTQIRIIRKTILPTQMQDSRHVNLFPPTCHPRSFVPPSPLSTSQPFSQIETLEMISGSNPGSFMVLMQIPCYQQTMLTSSSIMFQEFLNYHANIETQSLIFENDKTAISPSLSKAWG